MDRIVMSLVVLLALLTPRFAAAQPEPPIRVRDAIEQDSALVRILDRKSRQAIRYGTAYIVADDGRTLTLATAQHVIKSAGSDPNLLIELRFFGQDLWVTATGARTMEPAELDLAVLEVPRQRASFGPARRGAALPVLPTPEAGSRAWVYGHDPSLGQAIWRECWLREPEGVVVPFDGGGVVGGFSGGVLVSGLGPVAMVTERGPGDTQNRAISYTAISGSLSGAGVGHELAHNPATDALRHSTEAGLVAALYCQFYLGNQTYQYWSAIDLKRGGAGAFTGAVYNGHRLRAVNHVSLSPTATAVEAVFTAPLEWNINGNGAFPSKEMVFTLCSEPIIEDMVLLKYQAENAVCYLAVPSGSREFLFARLIVENVTPGQSFADLPGGIDLSTRTAMRRRNVDGPFASFFTDKGAHAAREFSLPARLVRSQPVTITGLHMVPDDLRRHRDLEELLTTIAATRVVVETLDGREVLDETTLGGDGARFVLRLLSVPDDVLRLRFENARPALQNGRYSVIEQVVVDYDALATRGR